MKIEQQNQKEKMLTDNIDETMENNIKNISSDISKPLPNKNIINETVIYQKKLNGSDVMKTEIKNDIPDFPDINEQSKINSEANSIDKNLSNNNDKSNSNWSENYKTDNANSPEKENIIQNGNIDNLFDSDSSLSSVSIYESDNVYEKESISKEVINMENNVSIQKNENISETENDTLTGTDSLENTEEIENISYFDDSSSITSLSSLVSDAYLSSSTASPTKPKRKLRKIRKETINNNDSNSIESETFPKRKRRRKTPVTPISSSHLSNNISTLNELNQATVPIPTPKRRGRKPKHMKPGYIYNYNQLIKINNDINNMWNTLCEGLKDKKQKNFEIPDSIVNDFDGLIRNPNNGDYINSYEWNIIKMSNDGKITSFLTSDTFIPKTLKCSKCQKIIEEDKKYYCEYCNSYYHCNCIKENIKEQPEIIQIDKPADIFKQAYNLNLSNNYLVHNADFKWCLQKKWICPNHKDKNPIPKPRLKNTNITQDKKIKPNIFSSDLNLHDDSSTQSLTRKSSQKKRKDSLKTDHSTIASTKTTSHTKKRSRNHSTTSTMSNNKPEVNIKKKENIILKFIPSNEPSSPNNHNNSKIEIKKKIMKFDPDVDPNIYIHLKNEEELSTDIINKVIPKESSRVLKPEVRFKATEKQIKLDFIKKVYKSSKEIEDWLNSLILFHQDIIHQLHHKNLISSVPPTPSSNSSSTYLIDTLCSAIDYSKKEDEYTKSLFETEKKDEKVEITPDNKENNNTTSNITSDDNIPEKITKDSLIYQQYCYWKYICRNIINE